VLIALFGGLAGIVAGSRKEKSNAIPGVAIATALMPPLCTAGYGLATGNLYYFFGAFYLFFINSVFISLSTYLIVRFMKFPKKEFLDRKREKTVRTYITLFTLLTIIPSVYLAYNIVKRTFWEKSVNEFISTEFDLPRSQIIASTLTYDADSSVIEISLIGERISEEEIVRIKKRLDAYKLSKTYLNLKQSGDSGTDMNLLRSDILKDLYERNEALIQDKDQKIRLLERELSEYSRSGNQVLDLANEAKIHYPNLENFTINRTIMANVKENRQDTLLLAFAKFRQNPSIQEKQRFGEWLKVRTKADTVSVIIQ
jgi:hypothetical protein